MTFVLLGFYGVCLGERDIVCLSVVRFATYLSRSGCLGLCACVVIA